MTPVAGGFSNKELASIWQPSYEYDKRQLELALQPMFPGAQVIMTTQQLVNERLQGAALLSEEIIKSMDSDGFYASSVFIPSRNQIFILYHGTDDPADARHDACLAMGRAPSNTHWVEMHRRATEVALRTLRVYNVEYLHFGHSLGDFYAKHGGRAHGERVYTLEGRAWDEIVDRSLGRPSTANQWAREHNFFAPDSFMRLLPGKVWGNVYVIDRTQAERDRISGKDRRNAWQEECEFLEAKTLDEASHMGVAAYLESVRNRIRGMPASQERERLERLQAELLNKAPRWQGFVNESILYPHSLETNTKAVKEGRFSLVQGIAPLQSQNPLQTPSLEEAAREAGLPINFQFYKLPGNNQFMDQMIQHQAAQSSAGSRPTGCSGDPPCPSQETDIPVQTPDSPVLQQTSPFLSPSEGHSPLQQGITPLQSQNPLQTPSLEQSAREAGIPTTRTFSLPSNSSSPYQNPYNLDKCPYTFPSYPTRGFLPKGGSFSIEPFNQSYAPPRTVLVTFSPVPTAQDPEIQRNFGHIKGNIYTLSGFNNNGWGQLAKFQAEQTNHRARRWSETFDKIIGHTRDYSDRAENNPNLSQEEKIGAFYCLSVQLKNLSALLDATAQQVEPTNRAPYVQGKRAELTPFIQRADSYIMRSELEKKEKLRQEKVAKEQEKQREAKEREEMAKEQQRQQEAQKQEEITKEQEKQREAKEREEMAKEQQEAVAKREEAARKEQETRTAIVRRVDRSLFSNVFSYRSSSDTNGTHDMPSFPQMNPRLKSEVLKPQQPSPTLVNTRVYVGDPAPGRQPSPHHSLTKKYYQEF